MTLASARHCTVSKTLPERLGHHLGLVRPLGSVNLLISHPLGSKDHNEPNLVLTELIWLPAIWVISTFQVINRSLWVIWGFLPPTVTERHYLHISFNHRMLLSKQLKPQHITYESLYDNKDLKKCYHPFSLSCFSFHEIHFKEGTATLACSYTSRSLSSADRYQR